MQFDKTPEELKKEFDEKMIKLKDDLSKLEEIIEIIKDEVEDLNDI